MPSTDANTLLCLLRTTDYVELKQQEPEMQQEVRTTRFPFQPPRTPSRQLAVCRETMEKFHKMCISQNGSV